MHKSIVSGQVQMHRISTWQLCVWSEHVFEGGELHNVCELLVHVCVQACACIIASNAGANTCTQLCGGTQACRALAPNVYLCTYAHYNLNAQILKNMQ